MVSKKEHEAITRKLILKKEAADEEAKRLRDCYEEIANERDRLQRDVDAHRARESARMAREHAEQQRARQEAEREDKRKRRQELSDGMLRMRDASEWAIVRDERGTVLELTVLLPADVEPIVHGVLTKNADAPRRSVRAGVSLHSDYANQMQESPNRIRTNAQRFRDCYGF